MMVEYDFINGKKTFGIETEYIDDKDDYIGQIIENQDIILREADKIRKSDNYIEIANNEKKIIREYKTKKVEPDIADTKFVSNNEYEILKLKIASQEAENEKLRLQIKLAKLQNKKEPTLFDEDMFEPYNENHENL